MDPAFENSGKEAGLEIWRIENFAPIPYDPANYGRFYSGDSYIVLHTKNIGGSLSWDIHFWLGKDTSQDESGTAAIKTVELDDSLGGVPVQYREVEGHESVMFLSYFKGGVRYLEGGVASGFKHVDPDNVEKKLLQVKGKRHVRVREVSLDVSSMNKEDCFILDAGKEIYVYVGQGAKRIEKLKAIMAANQVRDQDHAGRAKIHILDETCSDDEMAKFFEELGSGSPDEVADSDEADDSEFEKQQEKLATLYHVWDDESGTIQIEEVSVHPLQHDALKSQDCFILDTGTAGLFVWIGKECSRNERVQSMKLAEKFITDKGYPKWTKVQRVVDGGESSVFKQYFRNWKEPEHQVGLGRVYTNTQIAASHPEGDFDVSTMHREKRRLLAKNSGKAFGFMPDDGSGQMEIYRIENFELAPVDENVHGFFFGGDSYVMKYTYMKDGRENYVVYFWQGNESSQDERAASAIHAVTLDDQVGGKAVQVRVVQGQEPRHFLQIFKGHMVVFTGGHASGFKNVHDHDTYDVDGTRLFHVKGTCDVDVRALQVAETASSLNSDDVFVLETPSNTFVWQGKGSSDEEKHMAASIAPHLSPDRELEFVTEEEEPDAFWEGLGGKGEYTQGFEMPQNPLLAPRLYHCFFSRAGKFRAAQIPDFRQDDLNEDDVMILDSGDEIFLWIGNGATDEERKKSLKMAEEYIDTDPTGRCLNNTVIITVKQNAEPPSFTLLFPDWDFEFWSNQKSFEDIRNELHEANTALD